MGSELPDDDSQPLYRFWQPRYWGIWLCVGILRLNAFLPYRVQVAEGRALGWLLYHLLRGRRRIAATNIALCFPEAMPAARQELLREHFASLGITLIEHGLAWWASDALVRRLVDLRGRENLERAMAGGRGVILLTGHFGAQEFSGRAFGLSCPTTAGFYRPSRNPLVDEILRRLRKKSAPILIPKQAVRRVVRALRQGMPVWYAPDQSYRRAQSALIPFFGEPAMTTTALSELVRLGKAAVVPLFPTRLPNGAGYRLDILPALENFPGASPEADARRVNEIIEAHIRTVPEQYYWLHRRFKGRPEGYPDPY
ncbi:MAG: LpxL/LpxP family Kdo(2)-lipid IV(A) lauroyl/palmitoleoyl acyltransferase [Gammaproteobacteria bacterium]|nr:LpxL/LpxP family Kdo(2)-lipid IV(A) lauroyl/palmitoleoyl acyltransferase [Gammaproteobacteria bacterium]MDH5277083.1 LpxL/LpxP family Kdo(2)-lipid IV(A) lauroyl/palmitoleoyl acyltransferase [Gammaproteobacteria bacterium]